MQLTLWNWIPAGSFQLDVGLLVDPLSMASSCSSPSSGR